MTDWERNETTYTAVWLQVNKLNNAASGQTEQTEKKGFPIQINQMSSAVAEGGMWNVVIIRKQQQKKYPRLILFILFQYMSLIQNNLYKG